MPFTKYNLSWPDGTDPLQVEFYCLKKGEDWIKAQGRTLYHHYKEAMTLIWPNEDWHRWNELCLKLICENKSIGIMGPASSGKTDIAAKYALTDYWCFPNETCFLVSSTDIRGLELRVFGRMKDLFNRALDRHDWLDGNVLESMRTITTDSIEDDENRARVLNKGIICIPCLQGGRWVGIAKYQGIKQKRMRLIADECAQMGTSFLDSVSNLARNPDCKFIFLGNPQDPIDPLGQVCEPVGGWSELKESNKTEVWKTRFMDGVCVCLCGLDSVNNDFPGDKPRYPYLIHKKGIEEIASFWGTESLQYFSQAVGVMKPGLQAKRVITRELCRQHHALEKVIWNGTPRTKIYAIDAAYSGIGGDRCVGGWGEFGEDVEGKQILRVNPPVIIPVSINSGTTPEDQISRYVQKDIGNNDINPNDVFFDATGRGNLGSSFARLFGAITPQGIEFGGKPSKRPVRHDLYIMDYAEGPRPERRLKRCDEQFIDMVSELWLESRYIIECDQIRELPEDVMMEGCSREFGYFKSKYFVESKNDPKARERMKRSPDLYDWFVTLVEGARRKGFRIERLGSNVELEEHKDRSWWDRIADRARLASTKHTLSFK